MIGLALLRRARSWRRMLDEPETPLVEAGAPEDGRTLHPTKRETLARWEIRISVSLNSNLAPCTMRSTWASSGWSSPACRAKPTCGGSSTTLRSFPNWQDALRVQDALCKRGEVRRDCHGSRPRRSWPHFWSDLPICNARSRGGQRRAPTHLVFFTLYGTQNSKGTSEWGCGPRSHASGQASSARTGADADAAGPLPRPFCKPQ